MLPPHIMETYIDEKGEKHYHFHTLTDDESYELLCRKIEISKQYGCSMANISWNGGDDFSIVRHFPKYHEQKVILTNARDMKS